MGKRNRSKSRNKENRDLRAKLHKRNRQRDEICHHNYRDSCSPSEAGSRKSKECPAPRGRDSFYERRSRSRYRRSRSPRSRSLRTTSNRSPRHTSPPVTRCRSKTPSRSTRYKAVCSRERDSRSPSVAISLYSRSNTDFLASETNNPSPDGRNLSGAASYSNVLQPIISENSEQDEIVPSELVESEEISNEVRNILGPDPTMKPKSNFSLHKAVKPIWEHILNFGLPKEESDKLLDKYEIPEGCRFLTPPRLNPELEASMSNLQTARDQAHLNYQIQLGKVLVALGPSLNTILEGERDIPKAIRDRLLTSVADSGRMICKVVNEMSQKRRQLISPLMNKQIKDIVEKCPPGEFLFGPNLGEKIQTAKSMEKVVKDIRVSQYHKYRPLSNISPLQKRKEGGERSHTTIRGQLNRRRPAYRRRDGRPPKGRPSDPQKRTSNFRNQ
ncbi:uncharacterized protein LOC115878481 [Sitophilus oryzae]|uniref:Uncharacterized protein LOC115878481 n=1 Tax=Sitophilus oryzae TaxID=7048 RepID=A0A6J2XHU3_SITOR|nr:uncharacterized protein LOC115878481 [Sitophilus oryzae]